LRNYALPKEFILKKSDSFRKVIQYGTALSGEYFNVFYFPDNVLKIGFAVSNKVLVKPKRNRIKRMTREGVRFLVRKISVHAHIVFLAKANALGANHLDVNKEIEEHVVEIEKRLCS
jgi:ribonuclease P protein component